MRLWRSANFSMRLAMRPELRPVRWSPIFGNCVHQLGISNLVSIMFDRPTRYKNSEAMKSHTVSEPFPSPVRTLRQYVSLLHTLLLHAEACAFNDATLPAYCLHEYNHLWQRPRSRYHLALCSLSPESKVPKP